MREIINIDDELMNINKPLGKTLSKYFNKRFSELFA